MLENKKFFLHLFTFIRRHRYHNLQYYYEYYFWLKKKKDTDPDWQGPVPIRISIRQNYADPTGSGSATLVTGINAQICKFFKNVLHFLFEKSLAEKGKIIY
jgi:hypothetical protein